MGLYKIDATYFGEVKVISQQIFDDNRGWFTIPFREDEFAELGLPTNFVQDNHSRSFKNTVRGLHFQLNPPMGKLMRVTYGSAFLVAVDMRPTSTTFLEWIGVWASEFNQLQVWAPHYFARGFYAGSDETEVQYKCTAMRDEKTESCVRWDDPEIGIDWPIKNPILSEKDANAPTVKDYFKLAVLGA